MKNLPYALFAFLLSLPAHADTTPSEATSKKEKVSCVIDSHSKYYDAAGKEEPEAVYQSKYFEGVRSVWAQDGLSYSLKEGVHYGFTRGQDGAWTSFPSARSMSLSKMTKAEKDGLIVYTGERRSVKMSLRNKKLSETNFSFEETYSKAGDQEAMVKAVYDGKEAPVWNVTTVETQLGDNSRMTVETYQVPHFNYDRESKGTEMVLKYVHTCTYEKVAE